MQSSSKKLPLYIKVAARSLYTLVLLLLAGTIMWLCLEHGLSNETGIITVFAFLGLEILLSLFKKSSPGILVTSILLVPLIILYVGVKIHVGVRGLGFKNPRYEERNTKKKCPAAIYLGLSLKIQANKGVYNSLRNTSSRTFLFFNHLL